MVRRRRSRVGLPGGAAGEDPMGNAAWRRGRFDFEALFESFETVPEPFTPAQDDRHEDDVHMVDQVRLEELPNRADAATDPDVEVAGQGAGRLAR